MRNSKKERNVWEGKENDLVSKKYRMGQMKLHASYN